jgi:hypothetical protein
MPHTKLCVGCLEAKGDVPVIRRFDETLPTGESVGSYFTKDPLIEEQIRRVNNDGYSAIRGDRYTVDQDRLHMYGAGLSTAVSERATENQRDLDEAIASQR